MIPTQAVYEDDEFFAFNDISPQAPVHVLLIPKEHIERVLDVTEPELMGRAHSVIQTIARKLNLQDEGFRIVVNCGPNGGQSVNHLHFHILGGRYMQWPPG